LIDRVIAERLTFLNPENLRDLAEEVIDTERRGLLGAILEAGTALGGIGDSPRGCKVARATDAGLRRLREDPASDREGRPRRSRAIQRIVSGRSEGIGGDVDPR
jgi:hypothetical protein